MKSHSVGFSSRRIFFAWRPPDPQIPIYIIPYISPTFQFPTHVSTFTQETSRLRHGPIGGPQIRPWWHQNANTLRILRHITGHSHPKVTYTLPFYYCVWIGTNYGLFFTRFMGMYRWQNNEQSPTAIMQENGQPIRDRTAMADFLRNGCSTSQRMDLNTDIPGKWINLRTNKMDISFEYSTGNTRKLTTMHSKLAWL